MLLISDPKLTHMHVSFCNEIKFNSTPVVVIY